MEIAMDAGPGLKKADAEALLAQYGHNDVREQPSSHVRAILKRLWGPIPWMLEAVLVLEIVLGKTVEPAIIAGWLGFSAILGGLAGAPGSRSGPSCCRATQSDQAMDFFTAPKTRLMSSAWSPTLSVMSSVQLQ